MGLVLEKHQIASSLNAQWKGNLHGGKASSTPGVNQGDAMLNCFVTYMVQMLHLAVLIPAEPPPPTQDKAATSVRR
jgi:hypothetical protein